MKDEGWERKFPAGLSMMLSHRDAAQLIQRSIDAPPSVGYAVLYGMSNNTLRIHDIEKAMEMIGYEPQDDAGVVLDVDPVAGQYNRRAHP
jgi:hypothetical protein